MPEALLASTGLVALAEIGDKTQLLAFLLAARFRQPRPIVAALAGWTAWFCYIFWKLTKIPRVGHAVRYGIPVGVVGWGIAEMPAHFGAYSEIWLKPFDYVLANLVVLAIFTAGFVYVARRPGTARTAEAAS